MLAIKIGEFFADYPDNINIPIKVLNPMLAESGISEGFAYSFTLLNTPKNISIFRKFQRNKAPITISLHSIAFITGICNVKKNNETIIVEIRNEGLEKKNLIQETSLKDFEWPVIPIAESVDNALVKRGKWISHMNSVKDGLIPEANYYCFPTILETQPPSSSGSSNNEHNGLQNVANYFMRGEYFLGTLSYPYITDEFHFMDSVAPCLFMKFCFEKALKDLGIYIVVNELNDIPEYNQVIYYPGMHLDRMEFDPSNSSKRYNGFGTEIDLNRFILNKSVLELLNVLRELFGCYFVFNNDKVSVYLYKNKIVKKPIDLSKYCLEEFELNPQPTQGLTFKFDVDTSRNAFGIGTVWRIFREPDFLATDFKFDQFQLSNGDVKKEIVFSFVPLMNQMSLDGWLQASWYIDSAFRSGFPFTSSVYDIGDEWKPLDVFHLGFYRGNYPIFHLYMAGAFYSTPICSNELYYYPDEMLPWYSTHGYPHYEEQRYLLGTCSMFPTDKKSAFEIFSEKYWKLIANNNELKKMFNFPAHIIKGIIDWKNPNHIIQQRNMSFIGTVKEVSFTLYKNGVSPTLITYLSHSSNKSGTFNDDFNDDFVIQ